MTTPNQHMISLINAAARKKGLSYGNFLATATKEEIEAALYEPSKKGKKKHEQEESDPAETPAADGTGDEG